MGPPDNRPNGEEAAAGAAPQVSLRVPLARPWITYVLLGAIGLTFLAESLLGGSTNTSTLIRLGAQVNTMVAQGELWRLFAAMFLHIGLTHIAFNGWALFSVGREVEAYYGSIRFILIYLLTGLAGNIAYYVAGRDGLSAGASGAVFGIIGAETAYFIQNRTMFGTVGRQRLGNLAVLIGINLIFGFTVPGINNLAHLGGLVSGILLGLALAPRYAIEQDPARFGLLRLRNHRRLPIEGLVAGLIVLALLAGLQAGNRRWQNSATMLRTQAEAAYDAGDLITAQSLLEQAVAREPDEVTGLFNLGVVYLRQDQPEQAIAMLERARAAGGDETSTLFTLAVAYAATQRMDMARPLFETFLAQEPSGDRAAYARSLLNMGQ